MGQNSTAEVCRLLVVGPTSQVDLSVPTHIPLADLMPALLRNLGDDLADRGLEHSGWVVQRLGEAPLDEDLTVSDLDLLDGDTLHVRPRSDQLPPLDFDDLIDGVATGMRARSGLWRAHTTRIASLATLTALLGTVLAIPLLGGRRGVGLGGGDRAVTLAVMAAVLFAVAAVVARALRDRTIAAVVGCSAAVCSVEAVVLALLDAGPAHGRPTLAVLLLAGAGVGTAVTLSFLAVSGGETTLQVGLAVVAVAFVVFLAAWSNAAAGLGWTRLAALSLVVTVAARPGVPILGFRLAGMALPPLPAEPDDLQDDIDPESGARVLARTALADRYMTALHAASGAVSGAALVRLAVSPGWVPATLAVLVSLAQALALRPMTSTWHRLALGLPAAAGLFAVLVSLAARPGSSGDRAAFWLAFVLALVCVGVTHVVTRRRLIPIWGRIGDLAHTLALFISLPLVVSLLGGVALVRSVVN